MPTLRMPEKRSSPLALTPSRAAPRSQRQVTRFARPSLQVLAPFEQGPVPGEYRHGQIEVVEPLHEEGGSKQPISDATDDALTQNCVAPHFAQGSWFPPSLVEGVPASAPALPHASIAAQVDAPVMHARVRSSNEPHRASQSGGAEPHFWPTAAQTSEHEVDALDVAPLEPLPPEAALPDSELHAKKKRPAKMPARGRVPSCMRDE